MQKLIHYLGLLLFLPFWWLQRLVPRRKNRWIFGAWNGHRFSDNSKYLFLYVKKNHPEIEPVWLTRDSVIRDTIRANGGRSFSIRSFKGFYNSLTASTVLVSNVKKDVNYLFINGATLVHLWHGNPLKKIGLDDSYSPVNNFPYAFVVRHLFPMAYEFNYDYIVSNADSFTDKMASSYNLPIARVLETGSPRNDVFFDTETDDFNDTLRSSFKGCRLVYYMPTFRNLEESESLFTLPDYNRRALETFLEKENIVFVSKGHYVDNVRDDENAITKSRLVHLADNQVSDINFMLKDADALITDYSSAYFDFLLTERPLIFAAFDLERYIAGSRELYFDYGKVVAGPIVKNWKELYQALETIWGDAVYREAVIKKNAYFNKYHDAQNCKRTFDAIQERIT